jgi:hypothetical protein
MHGGKLESMVRQVNQPSPFDLGANLPTSQRKTSNKPAELPAWIKLSAEQLAEPPQPSASAAPPATSETQPPELPPPTPSEPVANLSLPAPVRSKPAVRLPKPWRWPAVYGGSLAVLGGIGLVAYLWLASLPPLPNCETITPLSSDAHRLYCAQEAARSGKLTDLIAGIAIVKDWSPTHPFYRNGQHSLSKWSKLVMQHAREKMHHNDYKGAIDALNQIPKTSPVHAEAQDMITAWKNQWQSGEAIYAKAQEAIKQQDWRGAFDQVTELGYLEHDYWRLQQADTLSKQILVQKKSQEALTQAKKLSKKLMPEQMGEAIELLQGVMPETEAWSEAQNLRETWSQNLLKIALQHWQEGNTSGAIQLAQQVPLHLVLSSSAEDLVKFSHAHKLVEDSTIEAKLTWRQLWSLLEATTAVQQIQPDSPVYAEAQVKLQEWQAQFQDLQKLQVANLIADLGQKPALESAIAKAKQIAPDRQRHQQAQTMIADWLRQIEQIEDSPYLKLAQQFAAANTIPGLQLAIAQAQVIPSHRGLWAESQSQIGFWQQQIQRIEDQPIMDKANGLAKTNKLDEAIAVVAEIRPERALYPEAQAAILMWKEKIRALQVAEDRTILDQALSAAGRSQLTDAIATAAQIAPGRPLYLEAQSAIGAWLRERDGNTKSHSGEAEPSADSSIDVDEPSAAPEPIESSDTSDELADPVSDEVAPEISDSGEEVSVEAAVE